MLQEDSSKFPVFSGLSKPQIDKLTCLFRMRHYPLNEIIFQQGQNAYQLYILVRGEVEIRYKPYDGPPLVVSRMQPGGIFGWSAVLGRDSYTSSAIASKDSDAYFLSRQDLKNICEQDPDTGIIFLDSLASAIAERLRSTHSQILSILTEGIDFKKANYRRALPHVNGSSNIFNK